MTRSHASRPTQRPADRSVSTAIRAPARRATSGPPRARRGDRTLHSAATVPQTRRARAARRSGSEAWDHTPRRRRTGMPRRERPPLRASEAPPAERDSPSCRGATRAICPRRLGRRVVAIASRSRELGGRAIEARSASRAERENAVSARCVLMKRRRPCGPRTADGATASAGQWRSTAHIPDAAASGRARTA